jgi:hypothetical protein
MIPALLAILAAACAPLWKMAASKPKSKGKSGANEKSASPMFKKSASPTFKKSDSPASVKDSGCVDIMHEILKACCKRLKAVLSAPANNRFNTTCRVSADNNLTQNPPRCADFVLTTSAILQIIGHKHEVEQGQTFHGTFPELASVCFTPNPTCPHQAISELGHPAGNAADDVADNVADDVGDDVADNQGGGD